VLTSFARLFSVPRSSAVWLVYLGILVVYPALLPQRGWLDWGLVVLLVLIFLPIYGWTQRHVDSRPYFWRHQRPGAILGVASILLLGLVACRYNPCASVLFVYAATSGASIWPRTTGFRLIALATALVPVAALISRVEFPWVLWSFVPPGVSAVMMGLMVLFAREGARTNLRLKMAQEEVARLARAAERERIARDLHDVLGHTLSTITLKSELASRLVQRDALRAQTEMREVERISREALGEVREALKGYRASGLQAEMANTRLALEAAGVSFDYFLGPVELSPAAENVLALALREAITNLIRHSGATKGQVRVERDGNRVLLRVEDDGVWKAADSKSARNGELTGGEPAPGGAKGAGITGMRARVEALGGQLVVTPSQHGTLVEVTLPLGVRTAAP